MEFTPFFLFLNAWNSAWDCCEIGIRLGTEHVIYQELVTFLLCRKRISILTGFKMESSAWNIFYIPEHNSKVGLHEIEFLRSWNAKSKFNNEQSSKGRWKEWGNLSRYHVYFQSCRHSNVQNGWLFFLSIAAKKIMIWANPYKKSYWVLSRMVGSEVTVKSAKKYWNPAFSRVDILLITIRIQQSIEFSERTR